MSNEIKKPKLFVILGPTAIGKSTLAFKLAERNNASIINADSLQVYRYLDIGTSKPSPDERSKVPHYMIDIIDPDQEFNAAEFRKFAEQNIKELSENNQKIILVGGTFLYVKIVLSGLIGESDLNPEIREKIQHIKEIKGLSFLYRILKKVDPGSYKRLKENDFIRIQRALEVYFSSGMKISELQKKHNFKTDNYEVYKLGLQMDRMELNKKINNRVDLMLENGFIEEIMNIREMGFSPSLKPMQSIGYKELNNYLDKQIEKNEAVDLIKQNTRRYAKRQSTWLRKETGVDWHYDVFDYAEIEEKFNRFFDD